MAERSLVVGAVFECLAERELEVQTMLRSQSLTRECVVHVRDFAIIEAERLEVGETPVGLAEIRIKRDHRR